MLKTIYNTFGTNGDKEKLNRQQKKMMEQFIPFGEIPKSPRKRTDLEVNGISYKHNQHSYRSVEFCEQGDITIASIGCSWVYGLGVAFENCFHEIVRQKLSMSGKKVVNWNFGLGGVSNDYIARLAVIIKKVLHPNLLLVNFTFPSRREYVDLDGHIVAYNPAAYHENNNMIYKNIYNNFLELSSPLEDIRNLFLNYKLIESLGIPWVFSGTTDVIEQLGQHISRDNYAGLFEVLDKAIGLDTTKPLDSWHPGPYSHKIHADKICNILNKCFPQFFNS